MTKVSETKVLTIEGVKILESTKFDISDKIEVIGIGISKEEADKIKEIIVEKVNT